MYDLISREAAVQLLRDKASGYKVSMFLTSGECHVARVVATECAADIKNLPAVDAVEVVRCKDCKYRGDAYECPKHFAHYHGEDSDFTVDDGYCELGEKLKLEAGGKE